MKIKKIVHIVFRSFLLVSAILIGLVSIIGTSGDEMEEPITPQGLNTLPTATISTPEDNAAFSENDKVTFSGSGTDSENGTLAGGALEWHSSKDGMLGIGTSIRNVSLSNGTHVITLTVTDTSGGTGSTAINVIVNPMGNTIPTATITSPVTASSFSQGDYITFSGSGTDPEDGSLKDFSLIWNSNLDGQIGIGNAFTTNTLSAGSHTIQLQAIDSADTTGVASVTITIGNTAPTATITVPAADVSIFEGESITFNGTGTDPEDGSLDSRALEWISNKDGRIGIGNSSTVTYLSSGDHTITLVATDSNGATGTDSVVVTVENTIPTATITHPATASSYANGSLVIFTGAGTDAEDGNLYGAALVWTSDLDGFIGTGRSFSISTLSVGTHRITLTVTDKSGAAAVITITVIIT
jgi:hypothetical protein